MRWCARLGVAIVGCWMAAGMLPWAAADDVVGESGSEKPGVEKDPLGRVIDFLSKNLVLGWSDGRLLIDRPATEAALYGPDFARTRYLVQQTLAKAPKLLVAEAVSQGLAPETAEKLFGGSRIVPKAQRDWRFAREDRRPEFRDDEPQLNELVETASMRAVEEAAANGILPQFGGMSSSGTGDGSETTKEYGPFKLRVRRQKTDVLIEATLADRSLAIDLREPHRLTVTLGEVGDPDGENGDFVLVKQTAKSFRAKCVRNGEEILKLEGDSFLALCRERPDDVQHKLVPLLRQMGLSPPSMPDDAAVKAEVMARLRRDAGGSAAGGAEEAAPGTLEVRKHQLGQLSAAIDAFRLLDDSEYLEELKEGASPEDAQVIAARLAAIAAGR
jgi:hypothetical protein